MASCPVCEKSLPNPLPPFCEQCGWDLESDPTFKTWLGKLPQSMVEQYEQRLKIARKNWQIMVTAKDQEKKLAESEQHAQKKESRISIIDDEFTEFGTPRILVIGCGGAGNNIINRLNTMRIDGAETIAINTDKQHLDNINADKKILIGKLITKGLGVDGNPELGKKAAELAKGTLEELFAGVDLVFITAGMGGGTGTGVAPVVASIAKEQGAIVIAMVSSPFRVERMRIFKAEEGIEDLRKSADTVIVLDNNRLLEYLPNLPVEAAFSVMDQLIAETVKGITETITKPSLINIDYADVKAVMRSGGLSVMLFGESTSQTKAADVVNTALSHPLLDVDYKDATGCLIHITSGTDLSLKKAEEIAQALTYELHDNNANVIWGAQIDESFEGKIRVIAIMTGIPSIQSIGSNQKSKK